MPFLRMIWSPSLAAAMAACTERKLVPLLAAPTRTIDPTQTQAAMGVARGAPE